MPSCAGRNGAPATSKTYFWLGLVVRVGAQVDGFGRRQGCLLLLRYQSIGPTAQTGSFVPPTDIAAAKLRGRDPTVIRVQSVSCNKRYVAVLLQQLN